MSSCSFWGWGGSGKCRVPVVALSMLGSGRRTGDSGTAGGPRAFPPHSGSAGDVTPVSPVSYVTGVAFSRVSSPIWWLSCVIFCVSLGLLSGFVIFCACKLQRGRKDKVLEKGQGLHGYLCFSPSSLSLAVTWRYRGCRGLCPFLLLFLAVQSRPEWQGMT